MKTTENTQNQSKHTPGPWSISGIAGDNHIMARVGHNRQTVALITGWPGLSPEEHMATKSLIAAAPELLEACKALLPLADREDVADTWSDEFNALAAAIAKAEGK